MKTAPEGVSAHPGPFARVGSNLPGTILPHAGRLE